MDPKPRTYRSPLRDPLTVVLVIAIVALILAGPLFIERVLSAHIEARDHATAVRVPVETLAPAPAATASALATAPVPVPAPPGTLGARAR